MLTIRPEAVSRFLGAVLLISMGILLSLFVVAIAGGAVPSGAYVSNPDFLRSSPPGYQYSSLDPIAQPPLTLVFNPSPASRQTAVLYIADWDTKPVKEWSLIAAAGLVFISILYFLLKRAHIDMSDEIFP